MTKTWTFTLVILTVCGNTKQHKKKDGQYKIQSTTQDGILLFQWRDFIQTESVNGIFFLIVVC